MKARIVVNGAGERVRQLMPVVHNLIFVQLDRSADEVKRILKECPYPTLVYTQHDHPEQWCMIPGHDMTDLRMMCDASFCEPQFVDSREYELREGHRVRIVHGPLCGLRGKLIRKSKKYYFVKTFDGFGVMVSVSRWCCEPDVDAEQPEVNQITN